VIIVPYGENGILCLKKYSAQKRRILKILLFP
jgi:hypothetical protein